MRINFCGFETASTLEVLNPTGVSIVTGHSPRFGTYAASIVFGPSDSGSFGIASCDFGTHEIGTAYDTSYTKFFIKLSTLPSSSVRIFTCYDDSSNVKAYVDVDSTGAVKMYDSTDTLVGTSTQLISANAYAMVVARVGTGVGARMQLRISKNFVSNKPGTLEFETTGNCGANGSAYWEFGNSSTNSSFTMYFDDIAIDDRENPQVSSVIYKKASAITTTWSDQGTTLTNISDLPPDDDTSYIFSNTLDAEVILTINDATTVTPRVKAYKSVYFLKNTNDNTDNPSVELGFRYDSTNYLNVSATTPTTNYSPFYSAVQSRRPNSQQYLETIDVPVTEVYMKYASGTSTLRCTQMGLMVENDGNTEHRPPQNNLWFWLDANDAFRTLDFDSGQPVNLGEFDLWESKPWGDTWQATGALPSLETGPYIRFQNAEEFRIGYSVETPLPLTVYMLYRIPGTPTTANGMKMLSGTVTDTTTVSYGTDGIEISHQGTSLTHDEFPNDWVIQVYEFNGADSFIAENGLTLAQGTLANTTDPDSFAIGDASNPSDFGMDVKEVIIYAEGQTVQEIEDTLEYLSDKYQITIQSESGNTYNEIASGGGEGGGTGTLRLIYSATASGGGVVAGLSVNGLQAKVYDEVASGGMAAAGAVDDAVDEFIYTNPNCTFICTCSGGLTCHTMEFVRKDNSKFGGAYLPASTICQQKMFRYQRASGSRMANKKANQNVIGVYKDADGRRVLLYRSSGCYAHLDRP